MTKEQAIKNLKAIIEYAEAYDYIFGKETRQRMQQLLENILENEENAQGDEMESEE